MIVTGHKNGILLCLLIYHRQKCLSRAKMRVSERVVSATNMAPPFEFVNQPISVDYEIMVYENHRIQCPVDVFLKHYSPMVLETYKYLYEDSSFSITSFHWSHYQNFSYQRLQKAQMMRLKKNFQRI